MRKIFGAAVSCAIAVQAGAAYAAADLGNGKKVYEMRCAACHGTLAAKKATIPQATDFFAGRYRLTGGDAKKIGLVIDKGAAAAFPKAKPPGSPMMAPVKLSAKDKADVTAFIKTLKKK